MTVQHLHYKLTTKQHVNIIQNTTAAVR